MQCTPLQLRPSPVNGFEKRSRTGTAPTAASGGGASHQSLQLADGLLIAAGDDVKTRPNCRAVINLYAIEKITRPTSLLPGITRCRCQRGSVRAESQQISIVMEGEPNLRTSRATLRATPA